MVSAVALAKEDSHVPRFRATDGRPATAFRLFRTFQLRALRLNENPCFMRISSKALLIQHSSIVAIRPISSKDLLSTIQASASTHPNTHLGESSSSRPSKPWNSPNISNDT